jgi:hypothetical protein
MGSSPWPDDLISRVGVKNIVAYRRLSKATLSNIDLSGFSDAERALIIELGTDEDTIDDDLKIAHEIIAASSSYQDKQDLHHRRRLFTAAAWLAGASWNQLAALFVVNKSSIIASSAKHLPMDRQSARIAGRQSLETIAAWLQWYKLNWDLIRELPPAEIAERFLTIRDD